MNNKKYRFILVLLTWVTGFPVYAGTASVEFRMGFTNPRADTGKQSIHFMGKDFYIGNDLKLSGREINKAMAGKQMQYRVTDSIENAEQYFIHYVELTLNEKGKHILSELTGKYLKHYLVIFVNNKPVVAPRIQGVIDNGKVWINNMDSERAATELANLLKP